MEDFEVLTDELVDVNSLFDTEDSQEETSTENGEQSQENKLKQTTEVNVNDLFTEPESGGSSNENNEEKENSTSSTKESTSPNKNFYSSIANALVEDGVTPDLDTSNIQDAESFAEAMKSYYESLLDETQKRVNDALNYGVEPSLIKFYENTLKNLELFTDSFIEDENNEEFRKRAIYLDLINRGYSKEDAQEELLEILDAGNDIKKAKRAVTSMKDFYNKEYKRVLNEAKEEAELAERDRQTIMANIRKDLLESTTAFGDIELTKEDRRRAYDAITKPIWKDPDTGEIKTAIQKYEHEHKEDFMKKLAIIYVKTNGFESFDNLIKSKVNKESKKALRELENKLSNTRRTSDGNLMFSSGTNDSESMFKGYSLDI